MKPTKGRIVLVRRGRDQPDSDREYAAIVTKAATPDDEAIHCTSFPMQYASQGEVETHALAVRAFADSPDTFDNSIFVWRWPPRES